MALAHLFLNLREYQIEKKGINFADAVIPRQLICDTKPPKPPEYGEEKQALSNLWSICFEQLLQFGYLAPEFDATGQKKCTPGKSYNCKSICLNKDKLCRFPFEGQAKNYADWMATQGKKSKGDTEVATDSTTKKSKTARTSKSDDTSVTTPAKTTKKSKKVSQNKPDDTSDSSLTTPTKTTKKSKKSLLDKSDASTPDSDSTQHKSTDTPERNPLIRTNDSELSTTRNDLIKRFGEGAVTSAEKNVQKILDDPDTNAYIRVGSSSTLELILGSSFKTAHELGKTDHDIPHLVDQNYLSARARVEEKCSGISKSAPDSDRPIYAYLGGSNMKGTSHKDIQKAYGTIAVKLKPNVKQRATFTGCDSFKSGIASNVVNQGTPPPPNAASLVSTTRHGYDKDTLPGHYPYFYADKSGDKPQLSAAAKAKDIDNLAQKLSPSGNKYVEAQIYGRVTKDDIAEIHFQPSGVNDKPNKAIAQFAIANNVALHVDGKKLSDKDLDDIINPPVVVGATSSKGSKKSPNTVNPPVAVGATSPKASQRFQDLTHALSAGDFDAVAKVTRDIFDDAHKGSAKSENDPVLKQLYIESNYDAKPQVATSSQMDALASTGKVMLARGVSGENPTVLTDRFKHGDYYVGLGIFGNGTYVAHSGKLSDDKSTFIMESDPQSQKTAWNSLERNGYVDKSSGNLRMCLADDAVVMTAHTMKRETKVLSTKVDNWEKQALSKIQLDPVTSKKIIDDYKQSVSIEKPYTQNTGGKTYRYIPFSHKNKEFDNDMSSPLLFCEDKATGHLIFDDPTTKRKINLKTKDSQLAISKAIDILAQSYPRDASPEAKEVKEKADKMRAVLGIGNNSDLGEGTSGRFAVVHGIDAVALTNSQEPKTYMNLLNRGKVIVQDHDLSYQDGQSVGLGAKKTKH